MNIENRSRLGPRAFAAAVFLLAGALVGSPHAQQPSTDAATVTAKAPGKAAAMNVVVVKGKVEAIDAATRTVTVRGPQGNTVEIPAGPEVKNFDRIRVGDIVALRYVEALALELKKGGAGVRERTETTAQDRAKPGEMPAVAAGREVKVTADVTAIDAKKQLVTLRGPQRTVDVKVRDPEKLKAVKVGDQVEVTYTEAVALSVEPAAPAPAKK